MRSYSEMKKRMAEGGDVPFSGPYTKKKDQRNSDGSPTSGASRAKQLAQKAMQKKKLGESEDNPREYDYEGEMAKTQLRTIARHAEAIASMLDDDTNMAEWVQSKIVKAEDYMSTVHDYMKSDEGVTEETNIEEEVVTELKKSTLGSYIKKAAKDSASKAYSSASSAKDNNSEDSGKDFSKSIKRQRGIAKATDRLAKEETIVEEECSCDCGEDPCVECGKSHHDVKKEALSPNQKKIDKNKNGKIDGADLAKLRSEELTPAQKAARLELIKKSAKKMQKKAEMDAKRAIRKDPDLRKPKQDRADMDEAVVNERNDANALKRKTMDAARGARYKLNNPVPDSDHKTAQAKNKAIGRALRNEGDMTSADKKVVNVKEPDGKVVTKQIRARKVSDKSAEKVDEVKKPTGDLKDACWKGYTAVGTKKKNGKTVPNCVPTNEAKMSNAEKDKAEDIVKGMKKNIQGFKDRYGKRSKDVMYATANKLAQKTESTSPEQEAMDAETKGTKKAAGKSVNGIRFRNEVSPKN